MIEIHRPSQLMMLQSAVCWIFFSLKYMYSLSKCTGYYRRGEELIVYAGLLFYTECCVKIEVDKIPVIYIMK